MKFSVYALFVVLPSLCVCTPLPDVSADATSGSGASVQTTGGGPTSVSTNSNSDANVNVNNPTSTPPPPPATPTTAVPPDTTAPPAGQPTSTSPSPPTPPCTAPPTPSPSGTDVSANSNSSADANVNVNTPPGSGSEGGVSGSGASGKPTQQGFANYSVLKISSDQFKSQIEKTTWFVAKYTAAQQEIQSEVTVCADRHVCQKCKAVKFQYVTENGNFIFKEWGYDGANLIFIQENICFSAQDFVILKADVANVMKATKDSKTATAVGDSQQVKSALSGEYAVLGTDFKNYFVGQTSCDKGAPATFVAFTQQIYECEEKQRQYAQQITQILQASGINESKLSKLTQKFDIDTDQFTTRSVANLAYIMLDLA